MFDALGSGSGTVTRTIAKGQIDIVYVGDAEADTFIMLEVDYRSQDPMRFTPNHAVEVL